MEDVLCKRWEARTAQSINAGLQDIIADAEEVHTCKHDKVIARKHAVNTVTAPSYLWDTVRASTEARELEHVLACMRAIYENQIARTTRE